MPETLVPPPKKNKQYVYPLKNFSRKDIFNGLRYLFCDVRLRNNYQNHTNFCSNFKVKLRLKRVVLETFSRVLHPLIPDKLPSHWAGYIPSPSSGSWLQMCHYSISQIYSYDRKNTEENHKKKLLKTAVKSSSSFVKGHQFLLLTRLCKLKGSNTITKLFEDLNLVFLYSLCNFCDIFYI